MTTNLATTKAQSEELMLCGVSADTADMHISNYGELWAAPYKNNQRKNEPGFAPAWSLSALLEVLPKVIKKDGITYKLNIDYPPIGQVAIRYNTEEDGLNSLIGLMGDDLIDLIVGLVKRLYARGYKFNETENQ